MINSGLTEQENRDLTNKILNLGVKCCNAAGMCGGNALCGNTKTTVVMDEDRVDCPKCLRLMVDYLERKRLEERKKLTWYADSFVKVKDKLTQVAKKYCSEEEQKEITLMYLDMTREILSRNGA